MQDIEPNDVWIGRDEVMLQMESESLELLMKDVTLFQQNRELFNPNYTITLEEMDQEQDESLC